MPAAPAGRPRRRRPGGRLAPASPDSGNAAACRRQPAVPLQPGLGPACPRGRPWPVRHRGRSWRRARPGRSRWPGRLLPAVRPRPEPGRAEPVPAHRHRPWRTARQGRPWRRRGPGPCGRGGGRGSRADQRRAPGRGDPHGSWPGRRFRAAPALDDRDRSRLPRGPAGRGLDPPAGDDPDHRPDPDRARLARQAGAGRRRRSWSSSSSTASARGSCSACSG